MAAYVQRRDPGHEEEEREDEVVRQEAVPLDVLQLAVDRAQPAPLGQFEEREQDAMSADDPKEVEAAQGVEREQAFRLWGRSLHGV